MRILIDIIISGDNHFLTLDLEYLMILTPNGFVEKYC